jgi:hypothetical protein
MAEGAEVGDRDVALGVDADPELPDPRVCRGRKQRHVTRVRDEAEDAHTGFLLLLRISIITWA